MNSTGNMLAECQTSYKKKFYTLHLVNPDHLKISIDALADELIAMKQISEVYVSDSDSSDGFSIRVRFNDNAEPRDIVKFFQERIDGKYGKIKE
ncbi:MAG: hypothetical protein QXS81_03715 [Candidatus Micrarchaeaceae archaeon]